MRSLDKKSHRVMAFDYLSVAQLMKNLGVLPPQSLGAGYTPSILSLHLLFSPVAESPSSLSDYTDQSLYPWASALCWLSLSPSATQEYRPFFLF